MKTKNK